MRQDALEAELASMHREKRALDLRAGRLFARIDAATHFAYRGCSTLGQFGEMRGYSAREARTLASAAKAVGLKPEMEERILSGALSVEAAAALHRLFENPSLVRDGEDWIAWAQTWSARKLQREIRKRVCESGRGEPASVLEAVLTSSGRESFERARTLASRKEGRALTEGETVEVLSDHYLASFDFFRRTARARRAGPTDFVDGRYVPAEVQRIVKARQGGR